jgi:hypothetical protein
MQSPSLPQLPLQLSPAALHLVMLPGQLTAVPATHAPLPLHASGATLAGVLPLPGVHTDPQDVLPFGYVHAFVVEPLHEPLHIGCIGSELHAGRPPTGAPVTGLHVPCEPATLHAWHWLPHAELQQYPSTQCPL